MTLKNLFLFLQAVTGLCLPWGKKLNAQAVNETHACDQGDQSMQNTSQQNTHRGQSSRKMKAFCVPHCLTHWIPGQGRA